MGFASGSTLGASSHAIVRQFTPNWFTVTMGTGILALAIDQMPHLIGVQHVIAESLWLLNIALFVLFVVLYAARWMLIAGEAKRIFAHSAVSMFFGAIPMGLATIINGFVVFGIPIWGQPALVTATDLWWIDMVMAVVSGVAIPYLMFTRQDHSIEKMTAIWLLPIAAASVTAGSAGRLIPYVADPHAALRLLILGYALWAFSVPLALSVLVILFLRLALHKLPPKDMAASSWLTLGPIGSGALGLLLLGCDAPAVFQNVGVPNVGQIAAGLGLIGGTVFWGYGVWWLLIALCTTSRYLRQGMPFNMGWWGFTFPIGVYAVATLTLARQTHLGFLLGFGEALVACLCLFWLTIAARTLQGAWNLQLFVSPCLVKGSIPDDLEADIV
jgi:C4-dicarboxylate transporter/malic acid transport protein